MERIHPKSVYAIFEVLLWNLASNKTKMILSQDEMVSSTLYRQHSRHLEWWLLPWFVQVSNENIAHTSASHTITPCVYDPVDRCFGDKRVNFQYPLIFASILVIHSFPCDSVHQQLYALHKEELTCIRTVHVDENVLTSHCGYSF